MMIIKRRIDILELHERIRFLRKDTLKISQTEFAEKLGVTRTVIKNLELNVLARPDQKLSLLKLMCKEFNVSEDWLLNGEGEMFLPISRKTQIEKLTNQLMSEESNSFKNRFVSVLADLTENEWEFLEEKAMQLCGIDKESDINKLYDELPSGKDIEKVYPPVEAKKKDVG